MISMRGGGSKVAAAVVGLGLLLGASAAAAQGHCTMSNLAGTYAYENRGSSTFVLGEAPPRHWSLTSAPLVIVGWFTLQADAKVDGEGWVIMGRVTTGLAEQPIVGELTVLDEGQCTAVLEWWGTPVPGRPPGFHRERLVFLESGREFRSVLIQSPSGTNVWTGRGHRITGPLGTCGPHLLKGDILLQGEGLSSVGPPTSAASSGSMLRLTVADDGSFRGTLYSKAGTAYTEAAVEGTFTVQPNCKVEARFASSSSPGFTQHGRGLIFDEGKRGFLIMPLETTQPDGSVGRPAFGWCELLSLGR